MYEVFPTVPENVDVVEWHMQYIEEYVKAGFK